MKKVHAIIDYSKFKDNDLVAEGHKIVDKSTGNPHAAGSEPTVAEIKDANKDFEDACVEVSSGEHLAKLFKVKSRNVLESKLREFSKYIDKVADGDVEIISGCGLRTSKPWSRRTKEDLELKRSAVPKEIFAKCRKSPGKGAYVWQYFYGIEPPENEKDWDLKTVTLQCSAKLSGFNQGDLLIRYCPVTKDGMQAWSEHRHIFVV